MPLIFWELSTLLLLFLLFVYSQLPVGDRKFGLLYAQLKKIYMTERGDDHDILWPEGSIFGTIWTLIHSLIFSAFLVYIWKLPPNDNSLVFKDYFVIWDGTILVFCFNMALNKLWSLVFMRGSIEVMEYIIYEDSKGSKPNTMSLIVGPIILFVLLASSFVIEVLLGLQNQWVPFGLYAPYPLWLCYALYLNVSVSRYLENKIDGIHPIESQIKMQKK